MAAITYQEQLDAAGQALAEALRKLEQAPRGLKPYREREADAARQKLREIIRRPEALARAQAEQVAPTAGPACDCGARLLVTKYGPVCAAGTHDG